MVRILSHGALLCSKCSLFSKIHEIRPFLLSISNFATNIRFENPPVNSKRIQVNATSDTLPIEILTKQVQQLTEIVRSDVAFKCTETDREYVVQANLQGNIDRNNLHVYLEEGCLVIETRKDSKGKRSFKTLGCGDVPLKERSIIFVRRSMTIPPDVDINSITTQSIGDNVIVEMPKLIA